MNTHDIELPPLPRPRVPLIDADVDLMDIHRLAKWCEKTAKDYARAAIEADRQRPPRADTETLQQLNEVLQYLENEVMKLEAAYGHNFKPHATKKARATVEKLKAAMYSISKRRGEPVAWRWSESNGERWFDWTTDWSHHDRAVKMGCLIEYAAPSAPQPAESCASLMSDKTACGSDKGDCDSQPAEPVKE